MALPKVLVVGQPFTRDSGGGITLTNLFSGWNSEELAVVCVGNLLEGAIDTSVCNRYYQLGYKEHKWVFPFSLVKRKYQSGPRRFAQKKVENIKVNKSKWRVRFIMDYLFPFLQFLGIFHLLSRIELSDELRQWLDQWQPDVIYAQAPTREMVLFCIAVQEYLQKPMVYHVMDDWPSTISNGGFFSRYWAAEVNRNIRELLSHTSVFMTISDYMAAEYEQRYGRPSLVFHNPIEVEFWKQYRRSRYDLNQPVKILYAGRTGLGIDSSLELIAKAVRRLNATADQPRVAFILQTGSEPAWVSRYEEVVHRPFLPYEDLPKAFAEADLLIMPYDFSAHALKFIRYSMPTKASEFMASGTPIIIFAPEDTALVKYATTYAWAEVITDHRIDLLEQSIGELIGSRSLREKLGCRAATLADGRHDMVLVSSLFQQTISDLQPAGNAAQYAED